MRIKILWPLACCVFLTACTPSTVGIGMGRGHHGTGGGVGVSFPVNSQSNHSANHGTYASTATGADYGASYPMHGCIEPKGLAPDRDDPYALRQKYWNEVNAYRNCLQAYIAKAKRDQQLIQDRIDQASREHQRSMTFGH
jgi:hypothetical protein